jgi:hypothetical protein
MNLYDDIVAPDASIPDGSTYDEFIRNLKAENVEWQNKVRQVVHTFLAFYFYQKRVLQLCTASENVNILERNISCLFATAKLEIKRKDEEITRLRGLYARHNVYYACDTVLSVCPDAE